MQYTVMSPWGETRSKQTIPLVPHPETIEGKTIGLFSHFKQHSPLLAAEVEKLLQARYPTATFKHFQYCKDSSEIEHDPAQNTLFLDWLKGVDLVICLYADMGSCAMFLAYNVAYIEKLGIPTVTLADPEFVNTARRGAHVRDVPNLRIVTTPMHDLSILSDLGDNVVETIVQPAAESAIEDIIVAMTAPLTDQEKESHEKDSYYANATFTGDINQVNSWLYRHGWTNGSPAIPPTRDAVDEMLRGTDLPPDYVVAELPPMLGKATVEKIAINAVMAGCLPTYMPILIAAVEAMDDPNLHLEGYTCSRNSWAPLAVINGPIRKAIGVSTGPNLLSGYDKASATISKAIAYIIMNISGVRHEIEDLSAVGHEARFGLCFGENEESSPWEPLQCSFGYEAADSTVTMFWPYERFAFKSREPEAILDGMCQGTDNGFDPGCCFVMPPEFANSLAQVGWSKQDVLNYVLEYARRPASEINIRFIRGNNHLPKTVALPVSPNHSTRKYWSLDHVFLLVGGAGFGIGMPGGGDHGGPICRKLKLPKNWEDLCAEYASEIPDYFDY